MGISSSELPVTTEVYFINCNDSAAPRFNPLSFRLNFPAVGLLLRDARVGNLSFDSFRLPNIPVDVARVSTF